MLCIDGIFFIQLQVKMMILKVVARTIGLHRLVLLNFYPFLQKYAQVWQKTLAINVEVFDYFPLKKSFFLLYTASSR